MVLLCAQSKQFGFLLVILFSPTSDSDPEGEDFKIAAAGSCGFALDNDTYNAHTLECQQEISTLWSMAVAERKTFHIYLDAEALALLERIQELAQRERRSVSKMLLVAAEVGLNEMEGRDLP